MYRTTKRFTRGFPDRASFFARAALRDAQRLEPRADEANVWAKLSESSMSRLHPNFCPRNRLEETSWRTTTCFFAVFICLLYPKGSALCTSLVSVKLNVHDGPSRCSGPFQDVAGSLAGKDGVESFHVNLFLSAVLPVRGNGVVLHRPTILLSLMTFHRIIKKESDFALCFSAIKKRLGTSDGW